MRIDKPTVTQERWLTALGMPGLENFELPDQEVAAQVKVVARQHGPHMARRVHHGPYAVHHHSHEIEARAIARVAARYFHPSKMLRDVREAPPLEPITTDDREERWLRRACLILLAVVGLLLVLAALGHAQANKTNAGPPARANAWFWNGTRYVPVETAAPFPITCVSGCTAVSGFADNAAFTAGTTPVNIMAGWFSSAPTNCTNNSACGVLLTTTRHLMTSCDNCSSSSFTDNAAFTASSTPIGLTGGWYSTSPTNCTSGNACAPQLTLDRKLFVDAFQGTSPWVVSANGGSFAVTGTFFQATQPVSIATMPTTPVTGTFFQATQPVSIASMPSTPVTGTFWQATQPVSGTFWQATQPISGTVTATQGTGTNLHMVCDSGCSSSAGFADSAAFTAGTTAINPVGGLFDDTPPTAITTGHAASARITPNRAIHINLRNQAGTEIGTSGAPVRIDPTGTTAQPVTGTFWQSTQPVSIATMPALTAGSAVIGHVIADSGSTTAVTGTVAVTESGTWTVQPGNTANSTPWLTTDSASSATGSAVPAKASYLGGDGSGNLTGFLNCDNSTFYDASTSGATQLVALVSGKKVYVCGFNFFAGGTVNVGLEYGTGTNCATGPTKITPAYPLTAQTGLVQPVSTSPGLAAIASDELCILTSAAVAVQALVYWTQF